MPRVRQTVSRPPCEGALSVSPFPEVRLRGPESRSLHSDSAAEPGFTMGHTRAPALKPRQGLVCKLGQATACSLPSPAKVITAPAPPPSQVPAGHWGTWKCFKVEGSWVRARLGSHPPALGMDGWEDSPGSSEQQGTRGRRPLPNCQAPHRRPQVGLGLKVTLFRPGS